MQTQQLIQEKKSCLKILVIFLADLNTSVSAFFKQSKEKTFHTDVGGFNFCFHLPDCSNTVLLCICTVQVQSSQYRHSSCIRPSVLCMQNPVLQSFNKFPLQKVLSSQEWRCCEQSCVTCSSSQYHPNQPCKLETVMSARR